MNIKDLKKAYDRGENITQILNSDGMNSRESIEIAYDLQAGSYAEYALNNPEKVRPITDEMGLMLRPHVRECQTILDCGTGEMTTLAGLTRHLPGHLELLAFDVSLSRIMAGREFAVRTMGIHAMGIRSFVAAMESIPLPDDSVDVVITSHALEPNHGREELLLKELFRVSRGKVVLFEPSWEQNSEEGRRRMDQLGYIRGLPEHIRLLGGELKTVSPLSRVANPLNPTHCYVIDMNKKQASLQEGQAPYFCPKSKVRLHRKDGYFWSQEGGYAYPIIEGVPILRESAAVLMTRQA